MLDERDRNKFYIYRIVNPQKLFGTLDLDWREFFYIYRIVNKNYLECWTGEGNVKNSNL